MPSGPTSTVAGCATTPRDSQPLTDAQVQAIYKAQQWIVNATDEEIALAMQPFFPDSSLNSLKIVAKSYRETDAWKKEPVMYEEDYNRLLDVIDGSGQLAARPDFALLVDNTIANEVMGN